MHDAVQPNSRMPASDRRSQILEVALNVFSKKGLNGATTKEIAVAAGVTEALIFRHFPTKQALYQAVLESEVGGERFHRWLAAARECMARNDDAGLFRAIATAIIESYAGDARIERVMLFAALEGNEQGLAHHRSFSLNIYELLRSYLEKRQREGALAGYHPGTILTAIAGMAQHYAMATEMFGFEAKTPAEDAPETFTRILMNGIQVK
jgi:TetR/AcrR family transcriptional regulator